VTTTKLRVVTIARDTSKYPDHEKDTLESPHLVDCLGCSDSLTFVLDPDNIKISTL